MYEIHCLKIEIHKVHEIQSKATLAKYRNPQGGFRTVSEFRGFRFLGRPENNIYVSPSLNNNEKMNQN